MREIRTPRHVYALIQGPEQWVLKVYRSEATAMQAARSRKNGLAVLPLPVLQWEPTIVPIAQLLYYGRGEETPRLLGTYLVGGTMMSAIVQDLAEHTYRREPEAKSILNERRPEVGGTLTVVTLHSGPSHRFIERRFEVKE